MLPWIVFASGACGLIYQSLWLRSLSLIFGSGSQAASLTLATFMGGLGLGAWFLRKAGSGHALKTYALIEAGMALAALGSLWMLSALPLGFAWLSNLGLPTPLFWAVKLALASLIVLPQATLAGVTMPLLIGYQVRDPNQWHQGLARLYLLNTLGAAFGVLAGAFVLMPRFGLRGSLFTAAALNLALAAFAWARRSEPARLDMPLPQENTQELSGTFPWLALGIGAFGLGLELLWTRSLCLVIGSSIYAFNLMLLAVLLGIALGTLAYERWLKHGRDAARLLRWLLLGLACLLPLQAWLIGQLPAFYLALKQSLNHHFASHQFAGFTLSFLSLLLVTAPLGALFPLLSHAAGAKDPGARALSSRLFAFNAAGAVLGALGAGFLLIPALGLQSAYAWMTAIPLSLGLLLWGMKKQWQARQLLALPLAAIFLCALGAPYFRPWDPGTMSSGIYLAANDLPERPDGSDLALILHRFIHMPVDLPLQIAKISRMLFYREDAEAVVAVRQSLDPAATTLLINGKPDAGDQDQATQKLLAHLPLLLHANPKNALIIGWGSGCTAGTAGLYPLESIDCAELVPATLEAAPFFPGLNRGVLNDPRLKMHLQDGRTYLLAAKGAWDLISSEPPNPWISGVANLFTSEFYDIASQHLNPGGIFCQFFHYYNMSADDLKVQLRTFSQAFPHASLWPVPAEAGAEPSGDLLLIGSLQPHAFDLGRFQQATLNTQIADDLRSIGILDGLDLYSACLLGRDDLQTFAGLGPLNTDDHPALEFSAPRSLYRSKSESQLENARRFISLDEASSALPLPAMGLFGSSKKQRLNTFSELEKRSLKNGFSHKNARLLEAAAIP